MPRLARKYLEGSFFHIMSQGINKNYIFDQEEDKKMYIYLMYKLKKKYNIKIIAYCIMSNHVHILLNIETIDDLSSYMHKINTSYAQYYNKKHDRVGFVFRNRFKSESIINEEHLYNCIKYIFDNPVRAKICKYPREYKFSNYEQFKNNQYIGENNIEYDFIDVYENSEERSKYLIERFLEQKKVSLISIKRDNILLGKLVDYLYKHNISFRTMEKNLCISREKIRKCYNNYIKLPK